MAGGLIGKDSAEPALKDMAACVAAWDNCEKLIAQTEAALAKLDLEVAAKALADLRAVKLPGAPFAAIKKSLGRACDSLASLRNEESDLHNVQAQSLKAVESVIAMALQRLAAWDRYRRGLADYLEGNWQDGEAVLKGSPIEHLHAFERTHTVAMLQECRERLGMTAERVKEAENVLRTASERIAVRDFRSAGDILDRLATTNIYRVDSTLRDKAAKLTSQVEAAEKEAADLYKRAAEAYQAKDGKTVRELYRKLKSEYSGTRVFDEHNE